MQRVGDWNNEDRKGCRNGEPLRFVFWEIL